MLNNRMKIMLIIVAFIGSSFGASCEKSTIEHNILNSEVFSLYKNFGFISILENAAHADLERGEKYWLAIDSRHEYLTLRTMDNKVIEVIIRNPDLVTKKGIGVGSTLNNLKKAYPNAVKLTHYLNGVKRQWDAYFLIEENIEVDFSLKGVVEKITLMNSDGVRAQSFVNEATNQISENNGNKHLDLYKNVLSTYTDCEGNSALAWVIVSPDEFPENFKGMYAKLKFLVDENSKPYDAELVEGSSEIAEWSKKALLMGKYPNKPSSCWMVKYEYVEDENIEN